ncbi:MAG: zinc dependent phospholipase C family protein [Candidatus Heimdallarchaeota archaeon]
MLFITHEYVIRQAVNQTEGLDRRLLPTILLGAYFPDIERFPISRFYNEPTHIFPSKTNPLWHTRREKAYTWGWQLHILADLLWHEGIYDPMEYPICVIIGKYDPIRQRRMSLLEHMMREIALDFYVLERSGESNWGVLENLSLKEIFHQRDVLSEFGFWFYRQVTRAYTRWFMPIAHVLTKRGKPRILARNYKLITDEVTPSVNRLLLKVISATAQVLQGYLEVEQDMSRTSREHIE